MPCVICGSASTVKSHIIPRSLFRLEARPGKQVIGNRRGSRGHVYLQSGFWDRNILCSEHEGRLHAPDDYAYQLCRQAAKDPERPVEISNPRPDQLVAFAAACVWRMAVSRSNGRPETMLGPYAARLRSLLFESMPFDPLLLMSRSVYLNGPEPLGLGMLPYIYHELGIRFWRFIACGIIFDLKLDNRAVPPPMRTLAVNAAREITLFPDLPQQVSRDQAIMRSLTIMGLPRDRRPG